MQALVVLFAFALSFASSAHDLSDIYPFKTTLNTEADGGLYELYWNFDHDTETISFAVRVQTTGWVGFGISPNGQMPNSDVIIGWVTDDGETVFHDRFARTRSPPAIDEQQDWILTDGEEEDGFTILEFSRKYITCDKDDLHIEPETARVIWAFHATDDPTSEELTFSLIHSEKGSASLDLLGGLPDVAPDPADLKNFDLTVDDIVIPGKDTTYWCAAFRFPEEIRAQTKYVTRFGPRVTEGNAAHVHHFLIYVCTGLNDTHVGSGGDCDGDVANEIQECRGGTIIAAWAVGGEDFVFPYNVGFPIGGEGFPEYAVMELHYDNPQEINGTRDSSGMRMWYTGIQREHDAGVIEVGQFVTPIMVIPPNAKNFTATGIANGECTSEFLPKGGIHVFANALHTHEVGHGLTLQHIRYNTDCDVYEELEPIDRNLQYDFNFQQINHLRREIVIMPGDILQLKCFYGTEEVEGVTLGGLSTRDEMCLAFFFYYPKVDLSVALSRTVDEEYLAYLSTFPSGQQILNREIGYVDGLNAHDWDRDAQEKLEDTMLTSTQEFYCGGGRGARGISGTTKFPKIGCSYIPPDQCSDYTPPTCCERINAGMVLRTSVAVLLVLSALAVIMG